MIIPSLQVRGETLHLHPGKGLFWEDQNLLMIADCHFGKASHFRKAGIAVPAQVLQANLRGMADMIDYFQPGGVLFLGDLFHSIFNETWNMFGQFIADYDHIAFELIVGNHDILDQKQYNKYGIQCFKEPHTYAPFLMYHHPPKHIDEEGYFMAGHLHPGVRLYGDSSQSLRLPCFHFTEQGVILPAFGAFTGLADISPSANDRVFVIAEEEVLEANG